MLYYKLEQFPFLKNGIAQIAWVVEDLDKSVEFFYKYFDVGPWYYYKYGHPLLKVMKINGKKTSYSMLTAVANVNNLRLELIQPLEGDLIYNQFVEKYGYGKVHHFGILVNNMGKVLKKINKLGIKVTMEGIGYGLDGDGYFAYLDTENLIGITLELMERPKRRHEPIKIFPS